MTAIGVGLIGLGRHGLRYARHLLEPMTEARLVAVCRRDARQGEAFAAAHGVRFHAEYGDLIGDPRVEALVVVTPPALTTAISLEAVGRGKPLLIEKPLATTAADAESIVRAAGQAGVPLMTAHTVRYEAAVLALRRELESVGARRYLVLSNRVEARPDLWRSPGDYGGRGVLLETGIHLLDLVRFLTGEEVAEARCEMDRAGPGEPESRALAGLRTTGGFHCVVDSSRVTGGRISRAEWIGEKGQIAGDWVQHRLWRVTSRDAVEEWRVENRPTVVTVLRAFLDALRRGTPMPVTGLDGQRAVEIAEACYASADQGGQAVAVVPR